MQEQPSSSSVIDYLCFKAMEREGAMSVYEVIPKVVEEVDSCMMSCVLSRWIS